MKYSIRKQFTFIFCLLMAGTVLLCWFINNTFLEKYYINNKQNVLLSAYKRINNASSSGDISTEEFDIELQKICEKYNISVIVLDAESQILKTSIADADIMTRQLMDNIFGNGLNKYNQMLVEETNYKIWIDTDYKTQMEFIEMWGMLDNGTYFLFRSALEGIKDSVTIANRFLAYVGVGAALLSGLITLVVTKKITDPIKQLTGISQRMIHLDFEAQYNGNSKTEIALLGQNINELSQTLEKTISELKSANNELLRDIERKNQIDEMRKEFLSNVSHELKTPIALIQGYAEGLQEGINDDQESRNYYCEVIVDEASKMNNVVKKLLTLNELEFGSDTIALERFDIISLIRNYIQSLEILIKQKEIHVELPWGQPVYVWADEYKIEEVISNYFSNAMNHVAEHGTIRIGVSMQRQTACQQTGIACDMQGDKVEKNFQPTDFSSIASTTCDMHGGKNVRISVYNEGTPIPEESLPFIWDKFYKADKARTREYGGSGVGLSIVKAIMESMNQQYGVQNHENGVEFWFEIERVINYE